MRNGLSIRERYMRDDLPVRLGGLAANLARVESFSSHPDHRDVVQRLVEESKLFIEWTAADAGANVQEELADLQRELVGWQHEWEAIWADSLRRAIVAERAGELSRRLLEISGLLA
jgi:hypothetical protein